MSAFDFTLEEETAEDNLTTIAPNNELKTSLFDISFKKYQMGNNVLDVAQSIIGRDLLSNICDRLVIQMVTRIIRLKRAVCGDEAVADDTAPSVNKLFDSATGKIKQEFTSRLTDGKIATVEQDYVFIMACYEGLQQTSEAYMQMFPTSTQGIQYAYNPRAPQGQQSIRSIKDAIEYRMKTNSALVQLKNQIEMKRKNSLMPQDYSEAAAMLNF